MKKILVIMLHFIAIQVKSQSSISLGLTFKPPLDIIILDKLRMDQTQTWENFIRNNYILSLFGKEIDPKDLKVKLIQDSTLKYLINIKTIK